MQYVVGVDPGVKTGVVLLDHRAKVVEKWIGPPRKARYGRWVYERCREIVELTEKREILVAVEDQFIPAKASSSKERAGMAIAALGVAKKAGVWIGYAEGFGWQVFQEKGKQGVHPSSWRSAYMGWSRPPPGVDSDQAVVDMARMRYQLELGKGTAHIAEAAMIGEYALTASKGFRPQGQRRLL